MYKSDFLLKQLEDIAVLIAKMIGFRKELQLEKAEVLLQEVYVSLNLDRTKVLDMDLTQEIDIDPKTTFFRLELIADTLIETYWIENKDPQYLHKAKDLLNYIQANGPTFSFDIVQKLEEIDKLLSK